jgi:hypothetical protein
MSGAIDNCEERQEDKTSDLRGLRLRNLPQREQALLQRTYQLLKNP